MIQSIERAMKIIDVLAPDNKKESWTIAEIAERTDLPVSTVYRLLDTLAFFELVEQISDKKQYKLGYKWMELGMKLFDKLDLREIARPTLEKLALEVEETIYFNIPKGNDSIIIDRINSPRNIRVVDPIGERIPLHIGGPNRTILANMQPQKVKQILTMLAVEGDGLTKMEEAIADAKEKGYSISFGEKTKGTVSVGAPIIGFNQKVLGTISAEFLEYDITDKQITFIIEKVKKAAQTISEQLGKQI
ncbi:IclR family transcriptional regulator [Virgibacillus dakarensis]|uniref:IclR family transcriptional regulator n=1 Tax=Virgibacillus dakarensis TaxID=1917889 RepID=UPI000B4526F8|nr:IclR family transcriptional regulator [Virgibacillus dakarensis]MBT2215575.1 IclR family transcriptional regulator [Virgibacillus dakarensis]